MALKHIDNKGETYMSFWEKYKDKIILGVFLICILNIVAMVAIKMNRSKANKDSFGPSPFNHSHGAVPFVLQPYHDGYDPSRLEIDYGSTADVRVPTVGYNTWINHWERDRLTP